MDLFDGPHNDVVQVYIDDGAGLVPVALAKPSSTVLRAGGQPADDQQGEGRADDPDEVEAVRSFVRHELGGLLPIQLREQRWATPQD